MDITAWLKKQKVTAAAYDADSLIERFLAEMDKGLSGGESSLAMIPAYIGIGEALPANRSVAVIDAGGTNLRTCIARFNDAGAIEISHFNKRAMPGRDRETSCAEFYTVLVDLLEPLKDLFECIGFCFSYPADILPDHDGRLLHWTKEIKIPGLVGRKIGAGLIEMLEQRGITGKRVVLLNDTVAALLAGLAQGQAFNTSSYVGFILGTGTNTAYVEQNANIGKLEDISTGSQVINVESGGFAAFERGICDIQLDVRSENPGGHVFEKVISGVYMGPLALELFQLLASEGVFSDSGGAALAIMKELTTIHVDNLSAGNGRDTGVLGTEVFTDADREIMKAVFAGVVERAALFTAVNITAAVIKSGAGQDPGCPVCVNIDGSTFYKTWQLPEKMHEYMVPLLAKRGLHIRCIQVHDGPITGAAIAALTTFHA